MKILILGASGQIGQSIYSYLEEKSSWEIAGTSRNKGTRFIRFDPFTDPWSRLGKTDVVINCVGQIQALPGMSFEKIHRGMTTKILENRKILGNPKIIQISALGASPDHHVEFLRTKGEADELLNQFHNTVVVRPSIVCTHRTMMVRKMLFLYRLSRLTGGIVFLPSEFAEHCIQPVMPEDLGALVYKLSSVPELPLQIEVGGPDKISFGELIELVFQQKGKERRLVTLSKKITDLVVNKFVSVLFPSVITQQQYDLLFMDNVTSSMEAETLLERPLTSTLPFWKEEFQ